jgi:uncharacterized protein
MSSHSENSPSDLPPLIAGLLRREAYPHPAPAPRLIETHISWVILAGEFAYKIKKPLAFGFLDFSSIDKRHHFCAEEIRLNSRLAPELYLAVVAITGTPEHPVIENAGPAIEWAVKMRAFPAEATLDRETEISSEQIDAIAEQVAAFHADIAIAPAESEFGTPEAIRKPAQENFTLLRNMLAGRVDTPCQPLLDALQDWNQKEADRLRGHFAARKVAGFIRECHGDLHLGNIAWVERPTLPLMQSDARIPLPQETAMAPLIFDALEFNPVLRHIDVISEIAFLSMDLLHRGRHDLSWRLLDRYLEQTGDIEGIKALAYYQVYRAMVRAKVAAIRASEHPDHVAADFSECITYLRLADRLAHGRRPALLLMHGVSGSGKTWLSQHLLEQLGAFRLRSDVTRKRLFGLSPLQASAAIPGGIYTSEASQRTLATLIEQARTLLTAGHMTIVDATFIHHVWRAPFQALADELGVDWRIISLEAPAELLQARISRRRQSGADASEASLAVLASQLANVEPFNATEQAHVLRFTNGWTTAEVLARIRAMNGATTA